MPTPVVSIIMNIRDGAAHLREALDSVMAQTFQDWELIIWDDYSGDESPEIARSYRDVRVRYFLSPEDTPLGRARRSAIQHAAGEWLAFLDQDDVWTHDKLQKQVSLVATDPMLGIVYGRTVSFSADGTERDFDHRHEFEPLPEGDIFTRLFRDSCFISMSSAMLRRSAVEEIGGIPDEIQTIPDYYFFVALASRYRARAVQEVICRYRVHANRMSHTVGRKMHEEALWLLDRWADRLDPRLLARRRRVHSTVLAVEELRRRQAIKRGTIRLLTDGSIPYLLSRPLVRLLRAVRRRVCRPCWRAAPRSHTRA